MLTNVVSYLLLGSFLFLQRVLRRGEQARSLRPSQEDRGSTRRIGLAYGFSILALILAPLLDFAALQTLLAERACHPGE